MRALNHRGPSGPLFFFLVSRMKNIDLDQSWPEVREITEEFERLRAEKYMLTEQVSQLKRRNEDLEQAFRLLKAVVNSQDVQRLVVVTREYLKFLGELDD